jgi:hypothetical protein
MWNVPREFVGSWGLFAQLESGELEGRRLPCAALLGFADVLAVVAQSLGSPIGTSARAGPSSRFREAFAVRR